MNPVRCGFIRDALVWHFDSEALSDGARGTGRTTGAAVGAVRGGRARQIVLATPSNEL
jgi:hypothetical protein